VDPALTLKVHVNYQAGRGDTTRKNYATGVKAFEDFLSKEHVFQGMFAAHMCSDVKPTIREIETALMFYVTWLRENRGRLIRSHDPTQKWGILTSSIKNYVVHVAQFFEDIGAPLPKRLNLSRYKRTLAGLDNAEVALPLPEYEIFRCTLLFLRECFHWLDMSDPDTFMFWTLVTSASSNAFRLKGLGLVRSKPEALRKPADVVRVKHLTFTPNIFRPTASTLFRAKTKTSKNVHITWGMAKNSVVNPVMYQRNYLFNRKITSTADNNQPLWQWSSGDIVTADSTLWVVKGLMLLQNIDPRKYNKISFRHGGAQEVTNQLLDMGNINKVQRLAHRWSSRSVSWKRYSDVPLRFK
jgi:hypothetical protein